MTLGWAVSHLIGRKVICIKACTKDARYDNANLPVLGKIYTIRELEKMQGNIEYLLVEIINTSDIYEGVKVEISFSRKLFMVITNADAKGLSDAVNKLLKE